MNRHHRRGPRPAWRRSSTSTSTTGFTRSLPHRATPATAYQARPKATPGDRETDSHDRVRTDRVDNATTIALRHGGRLYSIGIGRTHTRTRVLVLVHDLDVRIISGASSRSKVLRAGQHAQGVPEVPRGGAAIEAEPLQATDDPDSAPAEDDAAVDPLVGGPASRLNLPQRGGTDLACR